MIRGSRSKPSSLACTNPRHRPIVRLCEPRAGAARAALPRSRQAAGSPVNLHSAVCGRAFAAGSPRMAGFPPGGQDTARRGRNDNSHYHSAASSDVHDGAVEDHDELTDRATASMKPGRTGRSRRAGAPGASAVSQRVVNDRSRYSLLCGRGLTASLVIPSLRRPTRHHQRGSRPRRAGFGDRVIQRVITRQLVIASGVPCHSTFAVMGGHAAASSRARRMAWISSHVGWSRRDGLNRAAIRTRRSLAAMSAVDGWVLALYQGARRRRASVSAGVVPGRGVPDDGDRLAGELEGESALDGGRDPVAGLAAAEDLLAVFYRDLDGPPGCEPVDDGGGAGTRIGCDQGQVESGPGLVADEHDGDAPGAGDVVPQADDGGCPHALGLAVAGDRDRGELQRGGERCQAGQPVPLLAGRAALAGAGRGQGEQAGGSFFSSSPA